MAVELGSYSYSMHDNVASTTMHIGKVAGYMDANFVSQTWQDWKQLATHEGLDNSMHMDYYRVAILQVSVLRAQVYIQV